MKIAIIGKGIEVSESARKALEVIGTIKYADLFPDEKTLIEQAKDADVLVTWGTPTVNLINNTPRLNKIVYMHTGYDKVVCDDKLCERLLTRNIAISYTPGYATNACAEYCVGMLLMLNRCLFDATVSSRDNSPSSFEEFYGIDLNQNSIGIIGFGRIGQAVAHKLYALGASVCVYSRDVKKVIQSPNVKSENLQNLFSNCQSVIVTCDLNKDSRGLISENLLDLLAPRSTLISVARAEVFDLVALERWLKKRIQSKVAIDSFERAENCSEYLMNCSRCYLTPHLAAITKPTLEQCFNIAASNVLNWQKGRLLNLIPIQGGTI